MRTDRHLLLFLFALAGCKPAVLAPTSPLQSGEVLLVHTNDLHAHFRPSAADWLPGKPAIGGFRALDAWLNALERAHGDDGVLYLDGGDLLTGTPLMEYPVGGVAGGAMLQFLDAVGCDAWVLGNHELDRGWDNAAGLVAQSSMPVLSANVRAAADPEAPGFPGMQRSVVFERNGVSIGVVGLTTNGLDTLASPETMARLSMAPFFEAAQDEVDQLRGAVDVVVALTHNGVEQDRRLAAAVEGIDLIVGGHSHTALEQAETIGDTTIVQAGSHGRQLGIVRLRVSDHRLRSANYQLVDLDPVSLPGTPSPEVTALVDTWGTRIDDDYRTTLGRAPQALSRDDEGSGSSDLGQWAASVVRNAADADVGLYNRGGIRADLPEGNLNLEHLYEVFPFNNEVVTFEARGSDLTGLLLTAMYQKRKGWSPRLEFSGIEGLWSERLGVPELLEIEIGGERLDPARQYRVATNSYVAEQWEKHLQFEPSGLAGTGQTVREAAAARVEAEGASPPLRPALLKKGPE